MWVLLVDFLEYLLWGTLEILPPLAILIRYACQKLQLLLDVNEKQTIIIAHRERSSIDKR